jgi:hypothetical protein
MIASTLLTSNTIAKVVNNHWCQQVIQRHHQQFHQPALSASPYIPTQIQNT